VVFGMAGDARHKRHFIEDLVALGLGCGGRSARDDEDGLKKGLGGNHLSDGKMIDDSSR
jgi:hypothetical protein